MEHATAFFETDRASRYLQAMFKHFAHKVSVEYDTEKGKATMPFGELRMKVEGDALHFEVDGESAEMLDKMKYVVDAHIVRFAFREKLEKLDWKFAEPNCG